LGAGAGAGGRASSVSSRRSWAGIMQRFLKRVKEALACAESPARHPRCASAERSQLLCRAHRSAAYRRALDGGVLGAGARGGATGDGGTCGSSGHQFALSGRKWHGPAPPLRNLRSCLLAPEARARSSARRSVAAEASGAPRTPAAPHPHAHAALATVNVHGGGRQKRSAAPSRRRCASPSAQRGAVPLVTDEGAWSAAPAATVRAAVRSRTDIQALRGLGGLLSAPTPCYPGSPSS